MILANKFFILILILIIINFFLITLGYFYLDKQKKNQIVQEDTYYLLEKNTNQKKILKQLRLKKINIEYFDWRILSLIRADNLIPKAGEYLIKKNSTIQDIQDIFQNEKTIVRNFKLLEGTTSHNLRKKLLENPYLSGSIKNLKEGIYKPDTYYFKYGYSRNKLLERMRTAQNKILNNVWKNKPKDFILKSKEELLILASIIQKETSDEEDSKLVASVFINRLKKNMKLQSDVTLAYGFKINGQKITKNMLKSKNRYNTYYHIGLPPTAISYPGENALKSLKYIKKTNYLYFVSNGRGGHRFSETYSSHRKNIKLWKNSTIKD